jgi:hypothetical protein
MCDTMTPSAVAVFLKHFRMQKVETKTGQTGADKVSSCVAYMATLTSEERLKVMHHFCTGCGSNNPRCTCWNDE